MAKKATKKKTGRPSKYTKKLADKICALIAADPRNTMRRIASMKGMPSMSMICRWLGVHEYFREQYARAKESQAEIMVEEMLDIADDGELDRTTRVNRAGEEYDVTDVDVIQRSKLMIETRKWLAGKLKPKKYGDKVDMNHTGTVSHKHEIDVMRGIMEAVDGKTASLVEE